ncbi:MFS transporter [Streptomyces sp. SID13666]|uniref:MFS transporter n=1 Tax=Streptomyces sp. SID13666 TaxID=2706054 RepID=UPI0013C2408F|nr:MFS transporter [Streptomyces sp. SID13666]NEA57381.1 MFS transporter [Streptomyces sp. SID13666]
MTGATGRRARRRRAARIAGVAGLPELRGRGRFVVAHVIDSIGNGLLLPLGLLFFITVRHIPAATAGAAASTGQLAALPLTALAGRIMDRAGPKHLAVASNLVCAAGFGGFLVAERPWQIAAAYFTVQAGINGYYTSQRSLTLLVAAGDEPRTWFAFTSSLRNTGLAAGAAIAAAALALWGTGALTALVVADAASYCLAATLFATLNVASGRPNAPPGRTTWSIDRRYLALVLFNLPYVFAQAILSVLLALYATSALRLSAWSASVLLLVNTVAVALTATAVTAHLAPRAARHAVSVAYAVLALSMAAFAAPALPGLRPLAWPALAVGIVLFTVGEILCSPAMAELSTTLGPAAARGSHQALFQMSWSVGGAAAPVLFTVLLHRSSLLPWAFEAILCVLAALAVLPLVPSGSAFPSSRPRRKRNR